MLRKILQRSDMARNFLTLLTGTTIAQVIPVLISPLVTRLYTPDDLGLFGIYFSILSVTAVAATARYELAVVLPEKEADAQQVVGASLFSAVLVSLVLLLVVWFGEDRWVEMLDSERIRPWLYTAPLITFVVGVYQTFNYWLIRKKEFKHSAANRIGQKFSESGLNLGLGAANVGGGLILGDILGRVTMTAMALYRSLQTGFAFGNVTWLGVKQQMRKYWEYPVSNLIPATVTAGSQNLPVFIISAFFDLQVVGFFNLTRQLLLAPISLISRNISQVLLEQFSTNKKEGKPILPLLNKLVMILGGIAIIITVFLMLTAPTIFAWVFGGEWAVSGHYAQILVISFSLRFMVSPLAIMFPAIGKITVSSVWQVFYLLLMVSLYFVAAAGYSIVELLVTYAILESIAYVIYLAIIYYYAYKNDKG